MIQELLIEPVSQDILSSIFNISWWDINPNLRFTSDEIQQFLIARSYKIALIDGIAEVQDVECDQDGNIPIGKPYKKNVQRVIAIKTIYMSMNREDLPINLQSEEIQEIDILTVFRKEFKSRLLEKL